MNESLLQVWDYFLISGWKAILKIGLYIVTMDHDKLIDMNFEEILTHVSDSPQTVLKPISDGPNTIHLMLKNEFKRVPITFHLSRLQKEFESIHNRVDSSK